MARPHLVFSHHQNKVTAGVVVVCLVLDGGGLGLDDGDPVLLPDLEGDLLRTVEGDLLRTKHELAKALKMKNWSI